MVRNITMTNLEIYNIASALLESFQDQSFMLPVKAQFYFQKNFNNIVDLAQEIDKARIAIFDKYGDKDEEKNQYTFKPEVADTVNAELNDLFSLTQELKVYCISLDWFSNIELSAIQMQSILYMIEENENEVPTSQGATDTQE